MLIDQSILSGIDDQYYGIVYMYKNIDNEKVYIGQATKPIEERHKNHKSQQYNSYFHNALMKHGEDAFVLKVIDIAQNADELNEKERFWIAYYQSNISGYNLTSGGLGTRGYKHTDAVRRYLSSINMGKNNPMFGKHISQSHKEKLRESNRRRIGYTMPEEVKSKISKSKSQKCCGENNPMFGKHHTEETKVKIRNNRKKIYGAEHSQAVAYVQLGLDGNLLGIFKSGKDAHEATGCDRSSISACCRGRLNQTGGYKWMHLTDYENNLKEEQKNE